MAFQGCGGSDKAAPAPSSGGLLLTSCEGGVPNMQNDRVSPTPTQKSL